MRERLVSLNSLPFADNEFDYIRAAGIGLAVPEDRVCTSASSHLTVHLLIDIYLVE